MTVRIVKSKSYLLDSGGDVYVAQKVAERGDVLLPLLLYVVMQMQYHIAQSSSSLFLFNPTKFSR